MIFYRIRKVGMFLQYFCNIVGSLLAVGGSHSLEGPIGSHHEISQFFVNIEKVF